VLRLDADLTDVVARLDDLADQLVGFDTGNATDAAITRTRADALVARVDALVGCRR
jgi:hypothetical protein